MNLNKSKVWLSALLLLPSVTMADTLAFEVGGYNWNQDYAGDIQDGLDQIDLTNTLGLSDDSGTSIYLVIEHPLPLLPNIKLQRTEMEINASELLSEEVTFDGETYTVDADVTTDLDLSHTDATLYYEILDNIVSLDLGLTVRKFDGEVKLTSSSLNQSSEEEFDDIVPLLYLATRVDLPLTGLYAGLSVNWLSASDSSLTDYELVLGWQSGFGLGIKAGLRDFDLEYEDDTNEKANVTADGAFVGASYRF